MKKNKLLSEAINAFINGDRQLAEEKMRKHFVESATEINKKLEEEFEAEDEFKEEIEEDFHTDPTQSLTGEVEYPVNEEEEEEVLDVEEQSDDVPEEDENPSEEDSVDVPKDEWEEIRTMFDQLSDIFAEINNETEEVEVEDESLEDTESEDDEFVDVQFGDKVQESKHLKDVTVPSQTAEKSKSPVASNAPAPVEGVKPVKISTKEGSTEGDAESHTTEDHNNQMNSDKELMHDVHEPKETAEKSKSPLPKQ